MSTHRKKSVFIGYSNAKKWYSLIIFHQIFLIEILNEYESFFSSKNISLKGESMSEDDSRELEVKTFLFPILPLEELMPLNVILEEPLLDVPLFGIENI